VNRGQALLDEDLAEALTVDVEVADETANLVNVVYVNLAISLVASFVCQIQGLLSERLALVLRSTARRTGARIPARTSVNLAPSRGIRIVKREPDLQKSTTPGTFFCLERVESCILAFCTDSDMSTYCLSLGALPDHIPFFSSLAVSCAARSSS